LLAKEIPDPRDLIGKKQPKRENCGRLVRGQYKDIARDFEDWLEVKKFMFSPEEQIALRGVDHRGRKGQVDHSLRDRMVNVFVDWCEGSKDLKQSMIKAME